METREKGKILRCGVGLVLGLAVLAVSQIPDGKTRIIACDVGQGDGILLTHSTTQVLIDGGPSSQKLLSCLAKHMPFWDRQIELIVLTNTDYDHMTGTAAALKRYRVRQFVTADGVQDSSELRHAAELLRAGRVQVSPVEAGDKIAVRGGNQDLIFQFDVLWPPDTNPQYVAAVAGKIDPQIREQILGASAKKVETNTRSVVLLLTTGSYRALFMGDSGALEEKMLINNSLAGPIDYLKVGHHGSKYGTSIDFLSVIQPRRAVISVGLGNTYGHPAPETLARLASVHTAVERTDKEGEIVTIVTEP